MNAQLRKFWEARSPRDRAIVAALAVVLGALAYCLLVYSATRARPQLQSRVLALRSDAASLDRQAAEIEKLRVLPALAPSQTDLRTLIQAQAGSAGIGSALVRIDAQDANRVQVVFGAIAFANWLNWVVSLNSQHIRLDTCRIEAMSKPGLVSITATFVRAQKQ